MTSEIQKSLMARFALEQIKKQEREERKGLARRAVESGLLAYDFCPPCIQNYVRIERARRAVSGADAGCTEDV